ncbi:MAG TPA: DNA primase [Streptosporangiaceae bacterium]|nr:DNA primase [Streptosporangiaceae bacterium]
MPGRIRDEDIELVRSRSPIAEVVGEYLQLRNAGGGSLKGLCPFHDEKTPSFNVTPARGLFYCLAGETRVLTWEGVKPIRELAGGTHRILGKHGDWIDAPFRSFGVQPLMRLTLSRNGIRKNIYATAEHRWFVRSGQTLKSDREVITSDLRPGHRLVSKFPRTRVKQTTPSPFGIAHGVTFGDGTRSGSGSMAQLDAVKDVELLKWFPVSMMTQHGRRLIIHHLPRFFKELPPLDESVPYLYGWLAGYFAADGCISTTGTVMLKSAKRDELEYVRLICTRLGIGTYGVAEQIRVGFPGREPSSLFRIILVSSDLTEEFFLLDKHRFRFNAAAKAYERTSWVVREVAKTDRVEEVFCATVDEGHAFTLEDNILTGNCFSCAEGGDAIKFVQKIDGLSFIEAIERLAGRAGVELRYEQGGYVPGQEQSQRRRLTDAHRAAAEFYAERLGGSDAAPARAFLAERGFELNDIERFGVGYSPKAWEDLTRHLRGRGFTDAEMIAAGLSREGNRGTRDRFRGRLMWPIRDLSGDVIAFGARKLDPDDDGPKYLNTPETPLFRKSTVLYGADLAKREIGQRRQVVIVEGYTDVMACHLAGVPTAVATCGTSFGDDHIKVLRRLIMDADSFTGEVIFTFDGDAAGQRAAQRAFGMEEKFATQTYVTVEPNGLDPCDLRLAHGDGAVRDLVARRVPLFEFAIKGVLGRHDLNTTEGQLAALDEAAPIVAKIKDQGLRTRYAVNLDRWLGLMDERFVLTRVRTHAGDTGHGGARGGGQQSSRRRPGQNGTQDSRGRQAGSFGSPGNGTADDGARGNGAQPYDMGDPVVLVERELLKLAVQRPALCGPEFDALGPEAFTAPVHGAVVTLIAACGGTTGGGTSPREWAARLREEAPNERAQSFVTALAVERPNIEREPDARYAENLLARVGELAVSREINAVKARLQRTNPIEEQASYNRLFGDLVGLEKRRKALLDQAAGT